MLIALPIFLFGLPSKDGAAGLPAGHLADSLLLGLFFDRLAVFGVWFYDRRMNPMR